MAVSDRAFEHVSLRGAVVRSYDGWIIAAYLAFAVVACAAMAFAAGGPGLPAGDAAWAASMPLP